MKTELWLEKERARLENELTRNLKKKQVLELEINRQFEHLKSLEAAVEKNNYAPLVQERQATFKR